MKYLKPIYKALLKKGYCDLAIEWFSDNIKFYHPIAVSVL